METSEDEAAARIRGAWNSEGERLRRVDQVLFALKNPDDDHPDAASHWAKENSWPWWQIHLL